MEEEIGSFLVSCLFKNVEDGRTWAFTGVYGPVINSLREDLWVELSAVAFRWEVPWCVGGDFNVVRFPHERYGCVSISRIMRRFSDCISELELVDPPLSGSRFTWFGNQEERSMSRIDRFLCSASWEELCPGLIQSALPRITSYHNPILLNSGGIRSGRTPFRFENMWLLSEGFTERVGEWWNSYSVMGKPSFVLAKKLKLLKEDLRKWNSEVFGNLKDQKDKVVDEIRRWDLEEQYWPLSEEEKGRRSNAKEEFWKIAKFEEISWRQKSRNLWLKEGERNTRFFHRMAMLQIHEHMHKIWKNQVEEKSLQSGISSWIMNLPFDTKVKEWIDAEERYNQEVYMKNILPAVADKFLVDWQANQRGASILCFDEIQTVDVFAIVALSGIVSRLLSTGTVLVATSNRAPRELNQDGMQREIFLKFLAKLEDHCETVPVGSEIDYRRIIAQTSIDKIHYFWPLDSIKINEFENVWNEVARHSEGRITSDTIAVMFGRTLEVPQCCNGVARFTFEYLCGRPVGAADYIAIAKNFHTVFISDIPMMSMRIRDKARRFITLVDELYNYHCSLFCTAAASIDDLFQGTEEGKLFDLERQVYFLVLLLHLLLPCAVDLY
ncbi:hypothetical protein RHGRI_020977 [Rhododendron griersonianum]|uniref:AFG1-like ATPase family protein n=1 Tax=Rhododendron griersonianum TaxID=479676 RepID=A0AAV6JID9_9ERIC|nr:hypothetical protein RHGRI_020977 [Rhododendron griersonianum]